MRSVLRLCAPLGLPRFVLASLALLLLAPALRAQAPAWTVNPAAFEQNMSVVASVTVSGTRLSSTADRLAAFVGTEVRGVAAPTTVSGAHVYFLPVYANTGGEAVTFKVYDAVSGLVRELSPGVTFTANALHGSATGPLALSGGTSGGGSGTPSSAAWTVDPAGFSKTMSVVGALRYSDGTGAGVSDKVAAFVGTEVRGVATPVEVEGQRLFFLPIYSNTEGEAVTFKVASGTTIRDLGTPVTFATEAVLGSTLAPTVWAVAGAGGGAGGPDNPAAWTVSASAFDRSMNVVAALYTGGTRSADANDRVAAFVGGEVRGIAAPRLESGNGLVFLTVYGRAEGETVVFKAYDASANAVLAVAEAQGFAADAVRGSVGDPVVLSARSASGFVDDPRTWTVTPSSFEQTMSAVTQARVGTAPMAGSSSRVAAFVNGQVRGVSSPTTTGGQPLYFLTVHGRAADASVGYKGYDAATGRVYPMARTSVFEANRVEGSVAAPLSLTSAATPTSLFVFPGDATGDGRVNQNDLFPLSFYFGLSGPARTGASTQFRAELAGAWAPAEATLADMNGDGRVNQNDLFLLGLNYGRQRPSDGFAVLGGMAPGDAGPGEAGPRFSRSGLAGAATITGVVSAPEAKAGDTLRVSVRITGAGGVRAVGFQLGYDAAAFEPIGKVRGALFAAALQNDAALELLKQEPGLASYAATLSGTATPLVDGEVVVLRFRVKSGASGSPAFTLAAAEALDGSAAPVALTSAPFSVRIAARATQALSLGAGWNLIAAAVEPDAPAFSALTAGVEGLVLVKDFTGRIYWPEMGVATLNAWTRGGAYLVYMRQPGALNLSGLRTDAAAPVALTAGWNLVGYPRTTAMPTETALGRLASSLVVAKDGAGRVYWPALGVNTLQTLTPGQGYYVYLSKADALAFPASDGTASTASPGTPAGAVASALDAQAAPHYQVTAPPTPADATLLVRMAGAAEGTEVAAFTAAGQLVGAGVVDEGRAVLAVRARDAQHSTGEGAATGDGAAAGDDLHLRVWTGTREQPLAVTSVRDGLTGEADVVRFRPSAVWVAETGAATGVTPEFAVTGLHLSAPTPNPFAGRSRFTVAVEAVRHVRIALYDLTGREAARLHDGLLTPGAAHAFELDAHGLPSGVYVLRAEGAGLTAARTVVVLH